ncbi:hypothetical protein K435DRAFT_776034 [Dendrothele bispora CBS 962.96]|uniref:Large ribosomal subunit protein uL30m n=1 Tax=Dendrothele bispora (strain CBS 962.96) TaxID=1314807 RepID=A0A4S8MGT7_DENBC|nr:hypothetical protein K435DRAFT_776034 [Dendrothele bispora CBS 962.96]
MSFRLISYATNLNRTCHSVPSLAVRALATSSTQTLSSQSSAPNTHFKITLRRSAISLGDKVKETLISLGIHRRMQTVYHRQSPDIAGKILRVKELVEVENVPEHLVRTKEQQTLDRRATRGYKVIRSRKVDVI